MTDRDKLKLTTKKNNKAVIDFLTAMLYYGVAKVFIRAIRCYSAMHITDSFILVLLHFLSNDSVLRINFVFFMIIFEFYVSLGYDLIKSLNIYFLKLIFKIN